MKDGVILYLTCACGHPASLHERVTPITLGRCLRLHCPCGCWENEEQARRRRDYEDNKAEQERIKRVYDRG